MSLRLGDVAPDFTAQTTEGEISFHNYIGDSWVVLFSHPADYTPVCTTELGTVAKYKAEFEKRNTKVIALSVDGLESHKGWIKDINETQNTTVNFPIIADEDKKIVEQYGVWGEKKFMGKTYMGITRTTFLIDEAGKIIKIIEKPDTKNHTEEILAALK